MMSGILRWLEDLLNRLLRRGREAPDDPARRETEIEKKLNQAILALDEQLIEHKSQVALAITDEHRLAAAYEAERAHLAAQEARAAATASAGEPPYDLAAGRSRVAEYRALYEAQRERVARLKEALRERNGALEAHKQKRGLLLAAHRAQEAERAMQAQLAAFADRSLHERLAALEHELELEFGDAPEQPAEDGNAAMPPGADAGPTSRALLEDVTRTWRERLATLEARLEAVVRGEERLRMTCEHEENLALEWGRRAEMAARAGDEALAAEAAERAREQRAVCAENVRLLTRRRAAIALLLKRFRAALD